MNAQVSTETVEDGHGLALKAPQESLRKEKGDEVGGEVAGAVLVPAVVDGAKRREIIERSSAHFDAGGIIW